MFNAKRLTIARKRRRLTAKDLAEKVGVSPVTITRLEKGLNEPDPATISGFADVLGFPKEFFFDSDIDELDKEAASFRSLKAMTAKERDAAISAGALAYLLSDWVAERFNLPDPDLIDLGHERHSPSSAARSLRQYWGLGEKPIGNMLRLLESKGIRILSLSENTKNVDAFSCWRNNIPYIFLNTFKTVEHSRFDAAHEVGHLVLHRHGGPKGRDAEKEADVFASTFLMPEADLISRVPFVRSIDQLIRAKKRWGVSVLALSYRLNKSGLISDWHHRRFCIQVNQWGKHNEPEPMPREESVVWNTVLKDLWSDRVTKSHIAKELFIPLEELESLIYGLTGAIQSEDLRSKQGNKRPHLKAI